MSSSTSRLTSPISPHSHSQTTLQDETLRQEPLQEQVSLTPSQLDFSQRAELSELMDQPCSYEELRACLRGIARVNTFTLAYRPTLSWLDEIVANMPSRAKPLRIVDIGCGYGDMLRRIDAWAARRKITVALTGIDLNPDAIRAAKAATPSSQSIEWLVGDALSNHAIADTDIVISNLLTHHLSNQEIVRFLGWMERTARYGWFVNDLHRKPVPYHLFRTYARFSALHAFVRHDGPVSIMRSFVPEDWSSLCAAADIPSEAVSIREYRPARLCVGRAKSPSQMIRSM